MSNKSFSKRSKSKSYRPPGGMKRELVTRNMAGDDRERRVGGRFLLTESYEGRKERQSRRGAVLWDRVLAEEDNQKRIELLFLGVLSRRPSPDELAEIISVVDPAEKQGLADVFMALINTEEFRFVQ